MTQRYRIIGAIIILLIIWWGLPYVSIMGYSPFQSGFVRFMLTLFCIGGYYLFKAYVAFNIKIPDLTSEDETHLQGLHQSFKDLVNRLTKHVRFFKGRVLYDRPWYVVVGDKASGRSALIQHNGDELLYHQVASSLQENKGVGFDWYVSREAVYIDAHPQLAYHETSERNQVWTNFLRFMTKVKPLRPVNGFLVAISAKTLVEGTKADIEYEIQRIRNMLKGAEEAGIKNTPIYLFVTQMDKIPGFVEFCQRYSGQELNQVWGSTFPIDYAVSYSNLTELFNQEFDKLLERLQSHVYGVMKKGRNTEGNQAAFYFPRFFCLLKEQLAKVLTESFSASGHVNKLQLRGFYLTAVHEKAHGFDQVKTRAYYCRDIFRSILYKEAELWSVKDRIRLFFVNYHQKVWIALGVALLAFLIAWISGIVASSDYVSTVNHDVLNAEQQYQNVYAGQSGYIHKLDAMYALATLRQRNYSDWWLHLGFPFPTQTDVNVHKMYYRELKQSFQPYVISLIKQKIEHILTNLKAEPYTPNQLFVAKADLYHWVSVYVMFHKLQHMDTKEVELRMQDYWNNAYGAQPSVVSSLMLHLSNLLSLTLQPSTLDASLLKQANVALGGEAYIYRAYNQFKLEAEKTYGNKQLVLGGGLSSQVFTASQSISDVYTYKGWESFAKQSLARHLYTARENQWIFGAEKQVPQSGEDSQALQKLYALYWHDYANTWWKKIAALHFVSLSLNQSGSLSQELSNTQKTFVTVIQQIATNLTPDAVVQLLQADVGTRHQVMALTQFVHNQSLVSELNESLTSLNNIMLVMSRQAGENGKGFYQLASLIASNQQSSYLTLSQIQKKAPAPINELLGELLHSTTRNIFSSAEAYVKQIWNTTILPECKQDIAVMQPFSPESDVPMSFNKLNAYFGASGRLTQFYNQYLAPFAQGNAEEWPIKQKSFFGSELLSDAFFQSISAAKGLNNLLYDGSGQQSAPAVTFELTPKLMSDNLAQISIQYGKQTVQYFNGPQYAQKLSWPLKDLQQGVNVTLTDPDGEAKTFHFDGVWGVFQLFSHLQHQSGDTYVLSLDGGQVTFTIHVIGSGSVGVIPALSSFSCSA